MRITSPDCGAEYPLNTFEWKCPKCGGLLEIAGTRPFDPVLIDRTVRSVWRYRRFLPLPDEARPVTMGEGGTPVVPSRLGNRDVLFKLDFMMPTGSFKDRGSTVITSVLQSFGIRDIVEDSSGNAAASLAAYAARAGMRAVIFVPAHASPAKLGQIDVYGAMLRLVHGPRENSALAARAQVTEHGAYYASHYYNPFALAGMQTTAWELWEQLGNSAPDNVILPVGHGTNLVGMYRGFVVLRQAGLIDRLPRFFAVQAENMAPLAHDLAGSAGDAVAFQPSPTVAEGIAITHPVHGAEILRIIRETGGEVIAVSEDEISRGRSELARQGIFVEPTSATAVAALSRIQELHGKTVVSLTGSGLKSP